MPQVFIREPKMVAVSEPEILVLFEGNEEGALGSQISWSNEATQRGLAQLFRVRPDEVLVSIVVNKAGIRASFRRK